MKLWAYFVDNTVPGCGDPDCCGDWEDKGWDYHVSVEPMTAQEYELVYGGVVLEVREANNDEQNGYWAGYSDGTSSGWQTAERWFQKKEDREIQEKLVLEEMKRFKQDKGRQK